MKFNPGDRVFITQDYQDEPMAGTVLTADHSLDCYTVDCGAVSMYRDNPNKRDIWFVLGSNVTLCTAGIEARGPEHVHEPTEPGRGTSTTWQRRIYGSLYSFTSVAMPDGERRMSVSKYNGYVGGPKFACAWTPVHWLVRKP